MCHIEVPNVSKLENCADITVGEGPGDFPPDVFPGGGVDEKVLETTNIRERHVFPDLFLSAGEFPR